MHDLHVESLEDNDNPHQTLMMTTGILEHKLRKTTVQSCSHF